MYFLKVILCLGILEISTYIGILLSRKLNKKEKEYMELQNILGYIKTNIKYLGEDILKIFESLYEKYKKENWGILFKNVLDEINFNNISLAEAITKSINKYQFMFCADLNILKQVSNNLGKTDIEDQINNLSVYQERLKEKIIDASESKKKNEKMYRSLGIICGIMLVIVLI